MRSERGFRDRSASRRNASVCPLSTMSSIRITSRPSIGRSRSFTRRGERLDWLDRPYDVTLTKSISCGIGIARIRSATKKMQPLSTPTKRGVPSGWSRAICFPSSPIRRWISAVPIRTSMGGASPSENESRRTLSHPGPGLSNRPGVASSGESSPQNGR